MVSGDSDAVPSQPALGRPQELGRDVEEALVKCLEMCSVPYEEEGPPGSCTVTLHRNQHQDQGIIQKSFIGGHFFFFIKYFRRKFI
jgi:hypothetical protein